MEGTLRWSVSYGNCDRISNMSKDRSLLRLYEFLIIEERQLKNQNIIESQSLPKLFILLYTC